MIASRGVHGLAGIVLLLLSTETTILAGESEVSGGTSTGETRPDSAQLLPPWEQVLTGQDSAHVADLQAQVTKLREQAKYADAIPLLEEVVQIRRRAQGDDHLDTFIAADEVERMTRISALVPEAQTELEEALRAEPEWMRLFDEGRYREAADTIRWALAIFQRHLGDEDLLVPRYLNFLSGQMARNGDYAGAEALVRESLVMRRRLLYSLHPDLIVSVGNLGTSLSLRGDYAGAEPLHREALAMWRTVYGDESAHTARSMQDLASVLAKKGDYASAEQVQRTALAILRNATPAGSEDYSIAVSLTHLGDMLLQRGDHVGADQCHREALTISHECSGDEHPLTARARRNLAEVLQANGDYAGAEQLLRRALAAQRKLLGDEHPDVASTRYSLASLLHSKGDYAAAEREWVAAASTYENARLRLGFRGLERVPFATQRSPIAPLAACFARNLKPSLAWKSLEAGLSRGLLDEVSARYTRPLTLYERHREQSLVARLENLNEQAEALRAVDALTSTVEAMTDSLRLQREIIEAEFSRFEADMAAKYGPAAGETYELGRIQGALQADAALLAWVDVKGDSHAVDPNGEHWACMVKHEGDPIWVKLPGSALDDSWSEADNELPNRVREALGDGTGVEGDTPQALLQELYIQRLAPVEPHLSRIRRLVILPAGWIAGVPVEALTDDFATSYAPSASMYAWLTEQRGKGKELSGSERSPLLAVGDPVFGEPVKTDTMLPEPPDHGVMLAMVLRGSSAARSGLRSGDVILSYGEEQLCTAEDLGPAIEQVAEATEDSSRSIPVKVWREGETLDVTVAPGELGASPSSQPASEAVRSERRLDSVLERTRSRTFEPLPGTRLEVEAIAGLFAAEGSEAPTLLLGPEASERRLDELAMSGELGKYRHIHLATHALMDDEQAMRSALILSQEDQQDALERILEGEEVYDGRLTAEQIVRTWKLNADLVTLSGCETALGKESGGEGFLGFSQALFVAGARSLVLSLWEVEDTPTMLLMRRFYENLLGRFDGPRRLSGQVYEPGTPLPKVDALREAKIWLRELTWDELMRLEGVGEEGSTSPEAEVMVEASGSDRLYEHPHYWAAFILMGDPD
jgi:CHAT domain-containing protein/tetratricopeptide (TPR) repeat protein